MSHEPQVTNGIEHGALASRVTCVTRYMRHALSEGRTNETRTLYATQTAHCNTLQRTATQCNTRHELYTQHKQHTATHCNILQHTETHCSTLQHTATHCNTLQHTARTLYAIQTTHCNTLQHTARTLYATQTTGDERSRARRTHVRWHMRHTHYTSHTHYMRRA